MNLFCPNCQKTLTVPEQFAGQLMKCPLCSGQFTVPNLPKPSLSEVDLDSPIPFVAEDKPAEKPPVESKSSSSPPESTSPVPAFAVAPPEPRPSTPATSSSSFPSSTRPSPPPEKKPKPAPTGSPGDLQSLKVEAQPNILEWVPPVAIVLLFLLTFFPWVGIYPGGVPFVTQNAWQAALGGNWYTQDNDLLETTLPILRITDEKDASKNKEAADVSSKPGVSLLLLFYLVPFFLLTLAATLFFVAYPYLENVKIPPQITQLLPYRNAIVFGLNGVLLLFLTMQMVLNFGLESSATASIEKKPELKLNDNATTQQSKIRNVKAGMYLDQIQRTSFLKLAFWIQMISTVAAGLIYWLERRGSNTPLPSLQFHW